MAAFTCENWNVKIFSFLIYRSVLFSIQILRLEFYMIGCWKVKLCIYMLLWQSNMIFLNSFGIAMEKLVYGKLKMVFRHFLTIFDIFLKLNTQILLLWMFTICERKLSWLLRWDFSLSLQSYGSFPKKLLKWKAS